MLVRHPCGVKLLSSLISCLLFVNISLPTALASIQVSPPASPPANDANTVYSNFLGISLELSFINYYFGNDTNSVPPPMINYLSALRTRSSSKPVRLRLGGNSMDSSTYVPDQPDIIEFTDPKANSNDQPVNYSRLLFAVMKNISDSIGGVEYLIGLSLRDPNSTNVPLLAGDAQNALGDSLDAFLLGNEPDLYTGHGNRPNIANYTVYDYIGEYWEVFGHLSNTPQGDVLKLDKIAGPTICCAWDLASLLQSGWLDQFSERLKYVTLQHYPQDNCGPTHKYELGYYLQHSNAVSLAQWQGHGLQILASAPAAQRKPLLMDEFSSASCGGLPGISDTFGAAMWTVDYALQMASVGYAGAYLHTRERGVTYNLFDPPATVAGGSGAWTTNPTFYAYLPISEALQSPNGSRVVDLNVQNSMQDKDAGVAGYAIYDASTSNVRTIALFNFANATGSPVQFALPSTFFPSSSSSGNITVRYLTAPNVNEKYNIAWGNETYAGVGNGTPVTASGGSVWNDQSISCSGGCNVQVPGPSVAVVFIQGPLVLTSTNSSTGNGTSTPAGNDNHASNSATNISQDHWVFLTGVVTLFYVMLL